MSTTTDNTDPTDSTDTGSDDQRDRHVVLASKNPRLTAFRRYMTAMAFGAIISALSYSVFDALSSPSLAVGLALVIAFTGLAFLIAGVLAYLLPVYAVRME